MPNTVKAFYYGAASPLLTQMYKNGRNILDAFEFREMIESAIISFVLLSLFFTGWGTGWIRAALVLVASVTLLYVYYFKYRLIDIKFIRDCWKLQEELQYAHRIVVSEQYLRQRAEKNLVEKAKNVLECQEDPVNNQKMIQYWIWRFKQTHAVAFRFGLVEEKWDSYFAKARGLRAVAA